MLSSLPFELKARIFLYLPIFDTWRLRRVCTRWLDFLSSEEMLRAQLGAWKSHNSSDNPGCDQSSRTHGHDRTTVDLQSEIQHVRAHKLNRPFTVDTIEDIAFGYRVPLSQQSYRILDLKGKRVAYASHRRDEGASLVVRDLIEGTNTTLRAEGRETISFVMLSLTFAAFVSHDAVLSVWKFSDSPSNVARIQLPSLNVCASAASGNMVVLAVGQHNRTRGVNPPPSVTSILLFDAKTSQLRSIDVRQSCSVVEGGDYRLHHCGLLVDQCKEIVDMWTLICFVATDDRVTFCIARMRISFDGKVVCSDNTFRHSHEIRQAGPEPWTAYRDEEQWESFLADRFIMTPPVPTGYRDQYRVQVLEKVAPHRQTLNFVFSAIFDSKDASLTRDECRPIGWVSPLHPPDVVAWWKDLRLGPPRDNRWLPCALLVNRTFMVSREVQRKDLTGSSRIRVFCYNEGVQMPNAGDTGLWHTGSAPIPIPSATIRNTPRIEWPFDLANWVGSPPRHV